MRSVSIADKAVWTLSLMLLTWKISETSPLHTSAAVAIHTDTPKIVHTEDGPLERRISRSLAVTTRENRHKDNVQKDKHDTEFQFVKHPTDVATIAGESVILHCEVWGNPKPTITWNKDDHPLDNNSDHIILRKKMIKIRHISTNDQGTYTCVATNSIGKQANHSATVTVSPAPLSLLSCGQRAGDATVSNRTKRIVGGRNASAHWPWQVLIEYPNEPRNKELLCGGSLIADHWVLTAAHCIHNNQYWFTSRDVRVRVGVYNRTALNHHHQILRVDKMFTHPRYRWNGLSYDLALFKLKHPAVMTDQVGTICLPEANAAIAPGTTCMSTGWGYTEHRGKRLPDLLQEVEVPVVSNNHCNRPAAYNNKLPKHAFCAGYDEGGKDSCQNDSGGPLSCYQQGRWILHGVTNSGYKCGIPNKYGVYVQVSKLVTWIHDIIQTHHS